MDIAHVTPRYHPFIGGLETGIENIAAGMVQKGHRVEVLTLDPAGSLPRTEERDGVLIRRFASRGIYDYSPELGRYLFARGRNYDVVHAHSLHTMVPQVAAQSRGRTGRFPLVITGHYHGRGSTPASTVLLRLYRPWVRRFLRLTDRFLCESNFEADLLRGHFRVPMEKVAVVPAGVDVDQVGRTAAWVGERDSILVVGRLERYKNIDLAVRAVPYLDRSLGLVVIGAGPDQERLSKITAAAKAGGRVTFLGRIGREEVFRWYRTCRLVLNLSNLEAFGLTVIEGLAAGKPVLVNNRTSLGELAGRFGGVTAVDAVRLSPQQLAAAMEERMRTPFEPSPLEEYRWPAIVDRVLAWYGGALC